MDKKLRLSLIFQAAGNAVNFLKGVKGGADSTSRALKSARDRVTALQAATKNVSAFRSMETALGGTRTQLEAARVEARRLALANDAAEKPTKALSRALELANTKLQELSTKEQGQIRTLAELEGKLRAAGVSTNALGAHELGLSRDLKRANGELKTQIDRMGQLADRQRQMGAARSRYDKSQALAGTMQGAGQSALAAGVVTAAPLFEASRQAMTFETGMADVRKVVNFDTPQQFRQMGDDILTLSTRIPVASEGLTAIVAAAGQAGIARKELLGFAEDAGKMGIAFDTTADDAGTKMATWRTAFRMTQPEVRALADQINYLGNTGPANALAISNVVTRIGPLGEVAGLAAGEIAALGSTIVGMGVQEEIAATGIKNTMLALTKGTAATKEQRTAYKALGLDAAQVAKDMQRDAGGTIVNVMRRIGALSADKQSAILGQLFGTESVAAIAPLLTNLDLLQKNLGKVANQTLYAGSMQKEFESRAATTANAVTLLKQGVGAVAVEVGTNFLPAIQAGSKFLGGLATGIRAFSQAHPAAIKFAGGLLAIVAGGLIIFGGLAMAVAAVLGPFALLQLVLAQTSILFAPAIAGLVSMTGAAWGAAAAFVAATWPILLIIAGIAALAGAAFLIYRNWAPISAWFGQLWSGIKTVAAGAIGFIANLFMNFTPAGLLIGAIMRAWPALQALGGQFMALGRHLLSGLVNGVLGGIPALVSAVMGAGGRIIAGFKQRLGIHSPSRVFAELGDYTMQGMGLGITRSAEHPLQRMRRAAGALAAAAAITVPGASMASAVTSAGATFDRAPVAFERGPRIGVGSASSAAAPSSTHGAGMTIGTLTIQIYQQPGESTDNLVDRVVDRIRGSGGGAFSDKPDDSYGEA